MKYSVYMEEMDAFTYRNKLRNNSVVIIPVGALEQHGSHMAMCVDAALSKAMAGETAMALESKSSDRISAIVTAPINFGYRSQQRSGGGFHLSGTTSLSGMTLIMLAKDIVWNLIEDGARRIVLMNGHYENYQFVFEGTQLALEQARSFGIEDVRVQLLSYWDFVDEGTIDRLYPEGFTGWDLEHAGLMETSLMMLFHPDLVDMSTTKESHYCNLPAILPNYDVLPIVPEYTPPSGCLSSPAAASVESGEIIRDNAVAHMVEAIEREFFSVPARFSVLHNSDFETIQDGCEYERIAM